MIQLFCVRPKRPNIGNDAIFIGLKYLLRQTFGTELNVIQVPAEGGPDEMLSGLSARTIHEMNLYGDGVILGGGNLYENNRIQIDRHALPTLAPPLLLFSLSSGRIYDRRHQLVRRTDAMPDETVAALNHRSVLSLARDDETLRYLHSLGLEKAILGGCPTLLLHKASVPDQPVPADVRRGTLLSVRHPQLMSVPVKTQAKAHATVLGLIAALEADGLGPVTLVCHDTRDLAFAASLGTDRFVFPDDVFSFLSIMRQAKLVVSFRLHAFLPCLSFGTPAINISYDERSQSLVRTVGLGDWDIDFLRTPDVVPLVRDRCARLSDFARLRTAAQPTWSRLEATMRDSMKVFADEVNGYSR